MNSDGSVKEKFQLEPYLLKDKKSRQLSPNPATRHYLSHDVFTHVSAVPNANQARDEGPKINTHNVQMGDTVYFGSGLIRLESVVSLPPLGDTLRAGLRVFVEAGGNSIEAIPELRIAGSRLISPPLAVQGIPLQLLFRNVTPETGEFELATVEPRSASDWIILKAIVFPQIRLVWLGSIIMFAGMFISILRRRALNSRSTASVENVQS